MALQTVGLISGRAFKLKEKKKNSFANAFFYTHFTLNLKWGLYPGGGCFNGSRILLTGAWVCNWRGLYGGRLISGSLQYLKRKK